MSLRDDLMAIRAEVGALTPAAVVDAARPKGHPLHDRFEWNNRKAGELYRQRQAADLIRSVRVNFIRSGGEPSSVREFHSVAHPEEETRAYDPVDEIADDPLRRKLLLAQMRRDWATFKARYEHLEEFFQLLAEEAA